MKVLFCYYIPSGGMETLNRQREKSLKLFNIESHFLYSQTGSGMKNISDSKVIFTNNDVEIKTLIKKEDYDAIIINSDATLLKRMREIGYMGPLIFEVQGLGTKNDAKKFLQFIAKEPIEKYSDAILYPKTDHLNTLIQTIYPHKPRFTFHNCIDTSVFSYQPQKKTENYIIGWVGRIEENKNWTDCLKITKNLLRIFSNVKLWMFIDDTLTSPSQKSKFNYMLNKLNLENVVKIYNNISHEEMPHYYSTIADSGGFLLSTSVIEGFGYAVLEAISCQCPVLVSKSDGVQSFVIHNQTGKLYSQGNLNEAIHEAKQLFSNDSLRNTLAKQGVTYVKQHFSLEQYGEHFVDLLHQMCKI